MFYDKFSHGVVSYRFNGENVNVKSESIVVSREHSDYGFQIMVATTTIIDLFRHSAVRLYGNLVCTPHSLAPKESYSYLYLILFSVCIDEEHTPDNRSVTVTSPQLTKEEVDNIIKGNCVKVEKNKLRLFILGNKVVRINRLVLKVYAESVNLWIFKLNGDKVKASMTVVLSS